MCAILIICYLLFSGNTNRLFKALEVMTIQMETIEYLEERSGT